MHLNQEDDDLIIQEDSVEKFMNTLFKWKYIVMMCKSFFGAHNFRSPLWCLLQLDVGGFGDT